MNKISLYGIVEDTTVDGPGFRTALYAAGCHHFCPGCHNPDSWNIENGKVYRLDYLLDVIQNARFANVTFSGGEPLMQVDAFTELARRIKQQTNKNIWCYTGYLFENIYKDKKINKILPYIDVLVDGPFIEKMKDENLLFRGSRNQRIIDIKQTFLTDKLVLWRSDFYSSNQDDSSVRNIGGEKPETNLSHVQIF